MSTPEARAEFLRTIRATFDRDVRRMSLAGDSMTDAQVEEAWQAAQVPLISMLAEADLTGQDGTGLAADLLADVLRKHPAPATVLAAVPADVRELLRRRHGIG